MYSLTQKICFPYCELDKLCYRFFIICFDRHVTTEMILRVIQFMYDCKLQPLVVSLTIIRLFLDSYTIVVMYYAVILKSE